MLRRHCPCNGTVPSSNNRQPMTARCCPCNGVHPAASHTGFKMLQLVREFWLLCCLGREALSVSPQPQEEAARYV